MPEARGRGYGEALTWAATLVEPARPAVLIASRATDGALLNTISVTDLRDPSFSRCITVSEGMLLLPTASGVEAWGV